MWNGRTIGILAACFLLVLSIGGQQSYCDSKTSMPLVRVLSSTDLTESRLSDSLLRMLDFHFAPTLLCVLSEESLPIMRSFIREASRLAGLRVLVIVDIPDAGDLGKVQVMTDLSGRLAQVLHVSVYPTIFLLDSEGKIRFCYTGTSAPLLKAAYDGAVELVAFGHISDNTILRSTAIGSSCPEVVKWLERHGHSNLARDRYIALIVADDLLPSMTKKMRNLATILVRLEKELPGKLDCLFISQRWSATDCDQWNRIARRYNPLDIRKPPGLLIALDRLLGRPGWWFRRFTRLEVKDQSLSRLLSYPILPVILLVDPGAKVIDFRCPDCFDINELVSYYRIMVVK